ncbi:methyl-accepting chemotaxis protein [Geomonas paludis]|uniref:Chemotaxis protein n=1 Tax=Geomonas paludis TaxID=2740185 RepID=A0A6V8MZR1_9BACT|nr:methyl-accepting chemotaxis protein [Geomonas paludis]UPU36899.1 methyl-accepting chemotaxis protein [Geomonas paludis]GFO65570.1 chemotaxis protein [Geomonas paludis]
MGKAASHVVQQLSEAMMAGRLDVRGDLNGLKGDDAEIVRQINAMIDALVAPLRLAGGALDQIAHGNLPPFVIDEYPGEYNEIKQNINTLLAILYGMHKETMHLTDSIREGKLKTRGNDWDYRGIWKELITGFNVTLDAVIAPVHEAGEVLERLARYDLQSRMKGRYRGEHAAIRKAMNGTAQALHDAISQVSEAVALVSQVGRKITSISSSIAQGAGEQSKELGEAAVSLAQLSESAAQSAARSQEAYGHASKASEAIVRAKESMNRMLASMDEISGAADSTASIATDIDGIAQETGTLAGSTVVKAARMRVSAGGFGVVAQEIRKLSRQCSDTAGAMAQFEKKLGGEHQEEFRALIDSLLKIARFANLLGVNAAVEAAHVEGAGEEFRVMTDEIHSLAVKSADAAKSTGTLTRSSSELSRQGVTLSREIDGELGGAVVGAQALAQFTDEILATVKEQTLGLEQINQRTAQITGVTEKNASGAAEALLAARDLESQVEKLTRMVNRFTF